MSKTEKHESRHKTMYRSEGDSWRNGIYREKNAVMSGKYWTGSPG